MTNALTILLLACAAFTEQWEGRRYEVYICPAGYETIGVGHRIKEGENYKRLTDDEIDFLLWKDVNRALIDAKLLVSNFDQHPLIVRQILVDLSYNLGKTRLSKFKKTLDACISMDYTTMADELQNSKWYHQTGNRGKHHVRKIRQLN